MGNIIKFPTKQAFPPEVRQLKDLSDQIDSLVLAAIDKGIDPNEVAGLLAHRLGTLLRGVNTKSKLWDVCEKVLKKQAILD